MGKKRIALVGEEKKKPQEEGRKVVKTGKEHGRITDVGAQALVEAAAIEEKAKKLEEEIAHKAEKGKKVKKARPPRVRGQRYLKAKKLVDRNKLYPLSEAIKLLKKSSISRFNGSVEVHLVTRQPGLKAEVEFPHDTGKTIKVAIADDKLLAQIGKGKIEFNVLLSAPAMMPKLMPYARILGPKGLMPNPKAGTITDKPESLAKKLKGKTQLRGETKAPLLHTVIGKVDAPEKNLRENFVALVQAVGPKNIRKVVMTSTMGPGIKVDISGIID